MGLAFLSRSPSGVAHPASLGSLPREQENGLSATCWSADAAPPRFIGDIRAEGGRRCKRVLMSAKSSRPTLVEKLQRQKELEQEQSTVIVELYNHYRNGTFLSVDIVNSAKLKEGEDNLRVVRTFLAFHRYLTRRTRGALASLFSGDGVMCLFKRPQEA